VDPGVAARGFGAERILVRDLPLAPLGLWVARRLGVPVIVDMAEPYPLALRSNWQFDRLGGLDHLTRSPRLADAVERWVVRRQPRTLVVSEEAADRLVSLGLARERITLVRNTPVLSELPAVAPADRDAALRAAVPQLVFTGILVGDRGVEVAIAGVAELAARHGRKVELVVVGDGRARASYEEAARTLGVAERVRFTGFVPHAELPRHWQDAAVGLLPFHRCPHIDTTLANKLFDYMAMGLPIVASDARPMQRVLAETGAGVTFRAGDARDFARAVEALLADPGAALAMAERGRQAAQVTFRWERDAERLCEAVERP
jgi:glycosyltransferase involved in cell wall biosynthesis